MVAVGSLATLSSSGANYYVSTNGNNANNGTSWATAWKTVTKGITSRSPGDVVNLSGGQTFAETVSIATGGTTGLPVTLTSDPTNPATLQQVGSSYGIRIYNTGNVTLQNLVVAGLGGTNTAKSGTGVGIYAFGGSNLGGNTLSNLTVTGFSDGINIQSWDTNSLLRDVLVVNCQANYNFDGGGTWAAGLGGVSNVVVRGCQFNYNFGDPTYNKHTGSGFAFGFTVDGLMEHCIAHDNGGWGTNVNEGPVGLWAYDSKRITFQYCESYNNLAQGADGDGFDLDQNMQDSVIQYCYTHDNWGAGYLFSTGAGTWSNNILRYCISENDGRYNNYSGIDVYCYNVPMLNGQIYNNTIYSEVGPALKCILAGTVSGMSVRNNLFITASNRPSVYCSNPSSAPTASQMLFQGNDYWIIGGTNSMKIQKTSSTYYTNLTSWQSAISGQEKLNSTNVGFNVDPRLNNPGGGVTIGNTYAFTNLTAYKLQTNSPMIGAGLNLAALFGINPGTNDFYGTAIPQNTGFDVGAAELVPMATVSFDAPTNNAASAAYARVALQATVTPNGNTITNVQFLLTNGTVISQGVLSGTPNVYTNSWTPPAYNTNYSIAARAMYGGTSVNSSTNTITVSQVVTPVIGQVKAGAAGFSFSVTAVGASGQPYTILSSTNLVAPMTAWNTNSQGIFGPGGTVNYTSPPPLKASSFFKVRVP